MALKQMVKGQDAAKVPCLGRAVNIRSYFGVKIVKGCIVGVARKRWSRNELRRGVYG